MTISRRKLRNMIQRWNDRRDEYSSFAITIGEDNLTASNRYQGVDIGTRWCIEDLLELCSKKL